MATRRPVLRSLAGGFSDSIRYSSGAVSFESQACRSADRCSGLRREGLRLLVGYDGVAGYIRLSRIKVILLVIAGDGNNSVGSGKKRQGCASAESTP